MKKKLYYLFILPLLFLLGCGSDDKDYPQPEITIQEVTTTEQSVEVLLEGVNIEECAAYCYVAGQETPSPAQIWRKGQKVDAQGKDVKVSFTELLPQTNYRVAIVARNGEYAKEVLSKIVTTKVLYAQDYKMTDGLGWYYGDYHKDGNGYYYIALADGPITDKGLPENENETVVHVYLGADQSDDSNNASVPEGHFTLGAGYGHGSAHQIDCRIMKSTKRLEDGTLDGYRIGFLEGTVDIKKTGRDTYRVVVDMTLGLEEQDRMRCEYEGKIHFINRDPASYVPISEDKQNLVFEKGGGNYSVGGHVGIYNIAIYNTPTNSGGFITGAGDVISLTLLSEPTKHMDLNQLVGNFGIISPDTPFDQYKPKCVLGGQYFKSDYGYMPIGTYYQLYNGEAKVVAMGMAQSGNVKLAIEGDNVNLDIAFTTVKGKKVSATATFDKSLIIDYTAMAAPQATTPITTTPLYEIPWK